jgi:hypothetical protein
MGQAFKSRNPSSQYFGVEVFDIVAQEASAVLDGVVCADIENDLTIPLKLAPGFDTLVFGDVLEHLHDPWRVLKELRQYIEPGGVCVACIPNVAHWSLIAGLLGGKWDYADSGLLDRTHLRFFTLNSTIEMFRDAGWSPVDATPRKFSPKETELAIKALLPAASALGVSEAQARTNLAPLQWVIRATNGPTNKTISIAALGQKKEGGVTDARIDHPMISLRSLPDTTTRWSEEHLSLPNDVVPGVLVLHRHLTALSNEMEDMVAKGWTLVTDMDDDPDHFEAIAAFDYATFRAVHAVTVSTEHLRDIIRPYNANVQVLENAILTLPDISEKPSLDGKLRVFFGAINRTHDWQAIIAGVNEAALELKNEIEFLVVHDKGFHDALPEGVSRLFMPLLGVDKYMAALASCHVALLPLNDTPFNRCKSDLKLIECAAAQVATICSKVVYAVNAAHSGFSEFATTPGEWRDALLKLARNRPLIAENTARALAYVRQERMHAQQSARRLACFKDLIANRELEAQRLERIARMART